MLVTVGLVDAFCVNYASIESLMCPYRIFIVTICDAHKMQWMRRSDFRRPCIRYMGYKR